MILLRWWKSLNSIEKPFWIFGFLMHVLAFFYCTGYQHGDEHFQILEFAGYKLNLCTYDSLAWEFPAQMRPGLQPFIAFCIGKLSLLLFGKIEPFWISDMLRILSLILGFISMIAIRKFAYSLFQNANQINLISFFLNFLWFLPFLHARFSSENWSGIFMIYALYFMFHRGTSIQSAGIKSLVLSGICWGLAFESRFQIGIVAMALFVWILFYQRNNIKYSLPIIAGGCAILLLSIFIAFWLYDTFTFPPFNYFRETLLKSEDMFGVSPWYDYIVQSQNWFGFPFGLLMIGACIIALIKLRKSQFFWLFFSFVFIHSLIGHKEIRFLFPVFYLIPIIVVQLIPENWLNKQDDFYSSALKRSIILVFIVSLGIKSIITSISYASPDVNTFRKLNNLSKDKGKITVYCPYDIGYVMAHYYEFRFFKNKNISLRFYHNNEQLIAQNPRNKNEFILVWDHFTNWPSEQGANCSFKSISDYQKSFILRGNLWNHDEYSIYSFNP
jgi:phosphatidylinositol glycan class B